MVIHITIKYELIEEVTAALAKTNLRFDNATALDELYMVMDIKEPFLKKKVLNILLLGEIPDIILTSTSSDQRIAINGKIWIENRGKEPFYTPIKGQKNGGPP
jgi:hypothetical protein